MSAPYGGREVNAPHEEDAAPVAPVRPAPAGQTSWQTPWQRIEVGTPGPEFEAKAPGQYAFDFPDSECDGWSTAGPAGLTLRSASVRGAKHRYYRQPRQDAARAAVHESTGGIAFAVADGVSSATSSEFGALEACRAVLERMLYLLSGQPGQPGECAQPGQQAPLDFQDVARHAAERLRQLAQWRLGGQEPTVSDVAALYATTLVAGTVLPDPAGPLVELFRIGDSGAWLLDTSTGRYEPLFGLKSDADTVVVSNVVTPLPSVPDQLERTTARLTPGRVLLVGTDGFGDPLGDGDGQVGALFASQLAVPPAPLWLAHLLDFSRETFDDDRSLLAVWPRTTGGAS